MATLEEWVDHERVRLARVHADALATVARDTPVKPPSPRQGDPTADVSRGTAAGSTALGEDADQPPGPRSLLPGGPAAVHS